MIRSLSDILGAAGFVFAIAVCLLAMAGASKAGELTAAQQAARSGDAFRSCSSAMAGIPDACMGKIAPL
jgi:hypothetical protein